MTLRGSGQAPQLIHYEYGSRPCIQDTQLMDYLVDQIEEGSDALYPIEFT